MQAIPASAAAALATTMVLIASAATAQSSPDHLHPAWAPGGELVAYVERHATGSSIRVVNRTDGTTRMAREGAGSAANPAFGPSGRELVFSLEPSAGEPWRLMVLDLATGEERELLRENHRIMHPQWSPNGRFVSYVQFEGPSFEGPMDVMLLDLESGHSRRLTSTNDATEFHPKWRADSARLVFDRTRPERSQIIELDVASGEERELAFVIGAERLGAPSYAPNGESVVFARTGGRDDGLWIVQTESGNQRLLLAGGEVRRSGGPVFSPDGRYVLFHSATEAQFDLHLIGSDGSGLALLGR